MTRIPRRRRVFPSILLAISTALLLGACGGGGPATQVDLSLHDASLTTPVVPQGSAVSVSFAVTNESGIASSIYIVRASVTPEGGDAVTVLADFLMTALEAGALGSANRTITLPNSVTPGEYTLELAIDPNGAANLTNRGDDSREFALTVTEPVSSCTEPDEVVAFADPAIMAFVEARLASIGDGSMTCGNVAQIQQLNVNNQGVTSVAGVENLTGVFRANVNENAITDLSPMAGMMGCAS